MTMKARQSSVDDDNKRAEDDGKNLRDRDGEEDIKRKDVDDGNSGSKDSDDGNSKSKGNDEDM